jgi:hypothetical protein
MMYVRLVHLLDAQQAQGVEDHLTAKISRPLVFHGRRN